MKKGTRRTRNGQKAEQVIHYDGMEAQRQSDSADAASRHDVRRMYGVKQCLTKWGVDLNQVIHNEDRQGKDKNIF